MKELLSHDPTVMSLFNATILIRPTQFIQPQFARGDYSSSSGLVFPAVYQVNETVWMILQDRPDLLA